MPKSSTLWHPESASYGNFRIPATVYHEPKRFMNTSTSSDRTTPDKKSAPAAEDKSYYQAPRNNASGGSPVPKWFIPSIFIGGMVAFLFLVGRAEISRWYFASARNAIVDHRYEDAIEAADNGLKWDPDYVELISLRGIANANLTNFEAAIADQDQIIEIASKDDPYSEQVFNAKTSKAGSLQRMNQFTAAIDIWNEVVTFREDQYRLRNDTKSMRLFSLALNNRAYTEAQAHIAGNDGIDIELALKDIEKAVDLRGDNDPILLDTLGYLKLLNGQNEDAFYLLDMAVKLTKEYCQSRQAAIRREMKQVVDQRYLEDELRQLDEHYAIILHHRGEAYRAIGEEEKAEADIDEAVNLGFSKENGVW